MTCLAASLAACGGGGDAPTSASAPAAGGATPPPVAVAPSPPAVAPVPPPAAVAPAPPAAAPVPPVDAPAPPAAAPTPSAPPVAPPPPAVVFQGTAATGAAMVGAVVRVVDARGVTVATSDPVGADGRYRVTLADGARAPFVLAAVHADGESQVGVFDRAESSTVNVTPITSLIAARLSSTGTPQGLVDDFRSAGGKPVPTPAAVQASRDEVRQLIAPVVQAVGDRTDPVTGSFAVGGVGHDKVLDTLAITITPKGESSSNIEVTVRTKRDEATPMPAVTFASNAPALPVVPAVNQGDLGATGTSARIDAFLAELNACAALPLAERVSSTTPSPGAVRPGVCRSMFHGADPAAWLDNGLRIGTGSYVWMFTDDATTKMSFDRPVYEYTRAARGGQPELVVATMRWTNRVTGATDTFPIFLREQDGRLKAFGNQAAHPMSVRPWNEEVRHLRPDSVGFDFRSTGYNLLVPNLQSNGQPVYDRVVVQLPVGLEGGATRDELVLRPVAGRTHLQRIDPVNVQVSSQVLRLGGAFHVPRTTAPLHPNRMGQSAVSWIDGTPWSDERLERISHKSVWTFQYFVAGNTGSTPDAVQHMTTISRALSIRETAQVKLADLTDATRGRLLANTQVPRGIFRFSDAPLSNTGPFNVAWTVADGALAPLSVFVLGRSTDIVPSVDRPRYDFSTPVSSTQRQVDLRCPARLAGTVHCDATQPSNFSATNEMFLLELWTKDARQVESSRSWHTYFPVVRP